MLPKTWISSHSRQSTIDYLADSNRIKKNATQDLDILSFETVDHRLFLRLTGTSNFKTHDYVISIPLLL